MNASNVRHIAEAPYEATLRSRWGVVVRHVTLTAYADPAGEWAVMAYPGSQYGMVTNRAEFEELMGEWYDHMMAVARARSLDPQPDGTE